MIHQKQSAAAFLLAIPLAGVMVTGAASAADTTDFNQALARDYTDLSRAEIDQGDKRDAGDYAARAAAAASGQPVDPDRIEHHQDFLEPRYIAELSQARTRLTDAFAGGAREVVPQSAARAQASFDCWIEQAAEDIQAADMAACKAAYTDAMLAVDDALRVPVAAVVPMAVPPAPPTPPPADLPSTYTVFFDFDKSDITAEARGVLERLSSESATHHVSRIVAIGHASTEGATDYNQHLSQRRVDAVRQALLGMHVNAGEVVTKAHGEIDPPIATANDVREARNRQVSITIER
ncbi:MAG: OmpA family protein [Gammaproteobacteria bacterium]|nr:OmpA family protein [Gammaproteobacteria bacterium]